MTKTAPHPSPLPGGEWDGMRGFEFWSFEFGSKFGFRASNFMKKGEGFPPRLLFLKMVIARTPHLMRGTKPYPERSEGTLEIATGFALATTSSDCFASLAMTIQNYFFIQGGNLISPIAILGGKTTTLLPACHWKIVPTAPSFGSTLGMTWWFLGLNFILP